MAVSLISRKRVGCWLLAGALPLLAFGQTSFEPQGGEFAITDPLGGDQVWSSVAVNARGGYVAWEDAYTDGDGQGISARRLDGSFSGVLSSFRVNVAGAGDQNRPAVAALPDGGAVFVWQGGRRSAQQIYARFLSPGGTWITGDVTVNTQQSSGKLSPAVGVLADGSVVCVWSSYHQELGTNAMLGVFGQRFSGSGQRLGGEFQVNQTTAFNQRTPALAPLAGGGFVVVWVSEQQRGEGSVDLYARLYQADASPVSHEVLVNTETNVCANPSVAASSDGGFLVAWSQKDMVVPANSWDVCARAFNASALGGFAWRLNAELYGDQFAPKAAAAGTDYLVVWTSLGQDGSRDGVFGRYLRGSGELAGGEFLVNTTTISQQFQPAIASDGVGRFLVVWSSFSGVANGFDLQAQRYASTTQPLVPLDAPFVTVLSSNALSVTWPVLAGFDVDKYEVYADGATPPNATASVSGNYWTMSGLSPSSTHTFRVAYLLMDGRRSPLSAPSTNTTYGTLMYDVIPFEWMVRYFGPDLWLWPAPTADGDQDGAQLKDEFLAGTDPTNGRSVLRVSLRRTSQGRYLEWNTVPGLIYQVQTAGDLGGWSSVGGPRFAPGARDSMLVPGGEAGFYRVIRLR